MEVTSADDQEKMIAYRFYYGRINALLDYLDGKAQDIPPMLNLVTLPALGPGITYNFLFD